MLPFRIALRYLRSRKSHSVVNLISLAAIVSIAVPVAAAVLVLSLQRGLIGYIDDMYSSFDPSVRVTSERGRFFEADSLLMARVEGLDGVEGVACSIEGEVMLENGQGVQMVVTLRGVDSLYAHVVPLRGLITHGEYALRHGDLGQIVLGQGIAYNLSANPALKQSLKVFAMNPSWALPLSMGLPMFSQGEVWLSGVYSMDEATDSRYAFVDIDLLRGILRKSWQTVSALEILTSDPEKLKQELTKILPSELTVTTRSEQRASLFRIMNIERWIIFALLSLITAIAALSLTGAIVMMRSEKKVQSQALLQMGFTPEQSRRVFTILGLMIVTFALVAGCTLGGLLVWTQYTFGILQIGGSTMLLDAYPVQFEILDLLSIITITVALGALISWSTTRSLRFSTDISE